MSTGVSIRVVYWETQHDGKLRDFDGIDEFKRELSEEYVSVVQGRPGDCGGLHDLAVEIISSLSLVEVSKFLLSGVAFDLVKSGAKAFVLRPFLRAYTSLRKRNVDRAPAISDLRIIFQDTTLVIYQISGDSVFANLEEILRVVATHLEKLVLKSGERPFEIHVPVFEDPEPNPLSRFRVLLDVDETIEPVAADYFRYWGVVYDFERTHRVYDVGSSLLLDAQFLTLPRYMAAWELRWQATRPPEKPSSQS